MNYRGISDFSVVIDKLEIFEDLKSLIICNNIFTYIQCPMGGLKNLEQLVVSLPSTDSERSYSSNQRQNVLDQLRKI